MELTFLGTASTMPTKKRNHPAIHLKFRNSSLLFECGEGTQRQLTIAGISAQKINAVFISHMHGDHSFGLGGLLHSMDFRGRQDEIFVYGPKGGEKVVRFFCEWPGIQMLFPIRVTEIEGEMELYSDCNLTVKAFPLDHGIPCYGFLVEEKVERNLDKKKLKKVGLLNSPLCRKLKEEGRVTVNGREVRLEDVSKPLRRPLRVGIVMDTRPFPKLVEHVKGCDLLVCEATFSEELKEKAHDYGHMTAKDAARLAKKAGAKTLVLTHYSSRYEDEKVLEKEAREIFRNSFASYDFYRIVL